MSALHLQVVVRQCNAGRRCVRFGISFSICLGTSRNNYALFPVVLVPSVTIFSIASCCTEGAIILQILKTIEAVKLWELSLE